MFPEHTVEDNLVIGAKKGPDGEDEWSIRRVYDVFPLLEPLRHRIAGRLSGGEQQMLAIARTLMGNPACCCSTSRAKGLAPIIVQRIGALLRQLRGTGATRADGRAEHAFLPRHRQRRDGDRQGPDRLSRHNRRG